MYAADLAAPCPLLQATLAAGNVAATLQGYPAYNKQDVLPYIDLPVADIPKAAPSIVNAKELGMPVA
jgi:hydroxypyruvate reductase 1